MTRAFVLLVAAAVGVAACGGGSDPGDREPAERVAANRCDPKLEGALRRWGDAGFSGSIAISAGGRPRCLAAYGFADQTAKRANTIDTVFAIGSVSKSFAAAAILDLVDAGKLSLSDRAGDLVPDLHGPVGAATVKQLLLHTSGLNGSHGSDHQPLGRDEAVAAIGRLELAFEPGSDFLYSNAGYTLLALIIEETSGMSYRDYIASRILRLPDGEVAGGFWDGEPAARGPRAVGHLDDGPSEEMGDFKGPHWALSGNGDLAMTTDRLAQWTHALFTGGIVSPRSVRALTIARFEREGGESEAPGWAAYDASAYGQPFFASAGGGGDTGHNAVVVWIPEGEQVIAIASNTPRVTAEELLQAIGPALAAGDSLPHPRTSATKTDKAQLAAAAGTYELDGGASFAVAEQDGELSVTARGADAIAALFPLPEGVDADGVAAHEDRVRALVAGETETGRQEREAFEGQFGPIEKVELLGSVFTHGEPRTYVTIASATDIVLCWFTVNEAGGVGAAEVHADWPTLLLVPGDDGRLRPDDPVATGPELAVHFVGRRMLISGPAGRTVARRR